MSDREKRLYVKSLRRRVFAVYSRLAADTLLVDYRYTFVCGTHVAPSPVKERCVGVVVQDARVGARRREAGVAEAYVLLATRCLG